MKELENDPFLTEFSNIFEECKTRKSLTVTMKRSNLKPKSVKNKEENSDYVLLIRVKVGNNHISTTVAPQDVINFQKVFFTIVKANTENLKIEEKKTATNTNRFSKRRRTNN